MTPAPEPTIYDITDIPFFPWEPSEISWAVIAILALLITWFLFKPKEGFKRYKRNLKEKDIPLAKQDAVSAIDAAIKSPSDSSVSLACSRVKRYFEKEEDLRTLSPSEIKRSGFLDVAPLLSELDTARYSPFESEKIIELLDKIKERILKEV